MPAVKIAAGRESVRWSHREESLSPSNPLGPDAEATARGARMQKNAAAYADYYDKHDSPQMPRYESYDGSGYESSRSSTQQYNTNKPLPREPIEHYDQPSSPYDEPAPQDFNANFDDFHFHTPMEEPAGLNIPARPQSRSQDAMGRHLLYETALLDTQFYEILDINEVDELKKEHARLNSRIEAANRKLTLESKVKEAAHNIHRLYTSTKRDDHSDTPQSSDGIANGTDGHLKSAEHVGSNGTQGVGALHQAEEELAMSIKAVDDLNEQIKTLLVRKQTVESSLLRHTAAVLAEQASASSNGHTYHDDNDAMGFAPDEFDGIRDILKGGPGGSAKQDNVQRIQEDHEQKLFDMQSRLEQLNSQLRGVIAEASRGRGALPAPELDHDRSADVNDRLDGAFAALANNVRVIEQEQQHQTAHSAIEERLADLNARLHQTMQSSPDMDAVDELRQPPPATGQGYQKQLQHLDDSVQTVDRVLRKHQEDLHSAREANDGASRALEEAQAKAGKSAEYENVISGLWSILSSDESTRDNADDADSSPITPLREDFSLPAFNARVQHIFDVAKGSKVQQDILRRQIQQQRDLNGKSEDEKHAEVMELRGRYDELSAAFDATQLELAKSMASNEQGEREVNESRSEMVNVMNEVDQLRKMVDETQARAKEVDGRSAQLAADNIATGQAYAELQQEMENLESEVVRLTTELTMAKADLDGAYGTRQERKKEAGVAEQDMEALEKLKDQEIQALRKSQADRTKLLETELQDMMDEFQAMARESLELEKERGQLEGTIDALKEKCDQLEAQLADERVASIGTKAPVEGSPRESTSVMVLRQEFKRMMREARAEGIRALRTEQEERRKIEGDLRRHRQAAGPLGRQGLVAPPSPRPSSRSSHSRSGTLLSNSGSAAAVVNGVQSNSSTPASKTTTSSTAVTAAG
ncbi:unnamed protein product [Zymoseptoria tritici ST99CH_1A5]|uniref:Uncharacterized protein n=1 Tax=Zymoseptoria tritici ST99CH_1A5 TaxID=1276529 RepID=A0A1Y6LE85_ZYMTR|nr:unnamed protein product [Zymoseptoria tritici ST99CH_1A5]